MGNNIMRRWPALMPVAISVLLYAFTVIVQPSALNWTAVTSIVMLTLLLSFASAGQTLVLIGGGMDFTVGAVMSASAILTAAIMNSQDGRFLPAFGAVMVMSVAIGLLNGVCTVKIGLPPLIVTMAISNVVSRLQYILTQGSPLGYASPAFIRTVTSQLFGVVPSLTLYALVLFPLMFYILNRSRLGHQVYLVGNNPVAARLNGIGVNKVVILTYVISAVFSGFTGMLGAAYMQSAKCQMFDEYAYNSLIAVIVGGTALTGGVGTYTGTIAGALLMVVLNNTLTTPALQLTPPMRNILLGLVMVLLLILYNRGKAVRQ
ncbi:MAG: ABC transporter permease [Clostridia bacterium]|nr:ABC transporter permease [Clostridia bacterium]